MRSRGISIRKHRDVIKVVIFNDGVITYRKTVDCNDKRKIALLLADMSAKGVNVPTHDSWF